MKAIELLKDYKNIDFGCNMDDLHSQIDEAIKELEEYENDMDSYHQQKQYHGYIIQIQQNSIEK